MKYLVTICAILLTLCGALPTAGAVENDFTYITEHTPPSSYLEKGEVKGMAVDLLKEMWRVMGVAPAKIQVLPWSQGYKMALSKPNTVLFATARLAEREKLFKWVGPIRSPRFVLIGAKKKHISFDRRTDNSRYQIATVKNDAAEVILSRAKVAPATLLRNPDAKSAVEQLVAGKADLVALSEQNIWNFLRARGIDQEYEKVQTLVGEPIYFAFHKDTPDATIKQFQEALTTVKKAGTLKKIMEAYQINEPL